MIKISRKGFMQDTILAVVIAVALSVSFQSCQKDESILNAIPEADLIKSGQLRNATIYTESIDALILEIEGFVTTGDLKHGNANALISKLENAIKSLEKGNGNAAMNQLHAVANQVEGMVGAGKIDATIGAGLIYDIGSIFIDNDGKAYKTILIGDQLWMAENLAELTTDSWAYDNDESYVANYGRLYTWDAAQAACPDGWHLPTEADWSELQNYLSANGYNWDGSIGGNKVGKSMAATTNWNAWGDDLPTPPKSPGYLPEYNNRSGFSGLPGGGRSDTGNFGLVGYQGFWWSSVPDPDNAWGPNMAWTRVLQFNQGYLGGYQANKASAASVRFVRD